MSINSGTNSKNNPKWQQWWHNDGQQWHEQETSQVAAAMVTRRVNSGMSSKNNTRWEQPWWQDEVQQWHEQQDTSKVAAAMVTR